MSESTSRKDGGIIEDTGAAVSPCALVVDPAAIGFRTYDGGFVRWRKNTEDLVTPSLLTCAVFPHGSRIFFQDCIGYFQTKELPAEKLFSLRANVLSYDVSQVCATDDYTRAVCLSTCLEQVTKQSLMLAHELSAHLPVMLFSESVQLPLRLPSRGHLVRQVSALDDSVYAACLARREVINRYCASSGDSSLFQPSRK